MRQPRFKNLRIGISILGISFFTAIIGSLFYKYKETVFVNGTVVSEELSFFIKSPIDAQVVNVGARVNEKVDPTKTILSYDCNDIEEDRGRKLASQAYIINSEKILTESHANGLKTLDLAIENLREYVAAYTMLGKSGAVSKMQENDYKRRLQEKILSKQQLINSRAEKKLEFDTKLITVNSEIKALNKQLGFCKFKSPVSGTISDVLVKPQELVAKGQPLFKIYNPSKSSLIFNLPAKNIGDVSIGELFEVRVSSYPYNKYGSITAKVISISPVTTGMISQSSGTDSELGQSTKSKENNSFLLKAQIISFLKPDKSGNPPELKNGMTLTGLFKDDDRRLIYILSDQFVKIQNSIQSMRSRY